MLSLVATWCAVPDCFFKPDTCARAPTECSLLMENTSSWPSSGTPSTRHRCVHELCVRAVACATRLSADVALCVGTSGIAELLVLLARSLLE
jgi:hypothetical protein